MIIEYANNHIIKFFRDSNDVRNIVKISTKEFPVYFYVGIDDEVPKDERILRVEDCTKKTLYGQAVKKIIVRNQFELKQVASSFYKTYEGDLPFVWRYWVDAVKEVPVERLRKLYLDIETEDMPDAQLNNKPITCIGFLDSYTGLYHTFIIDQTKIEFTIENRGDHIIYYCYSEYILLSKFVDMIHDLDPDMIIAHNGDRFDFPVIVGRLVALSIMGYGKMSPLGIVKRENYFGEWKTKIGGRILFDFLGSKSNHGIKGGIRGLLDGRDITIKGKDGEDRIVRIKRWSLAYLAQFVGMQKGKYNKVETVEEMIKYNRLDVAIMVELDKFFNVTEYYHNMQILIGSPYEATYFNTNMIDIFLLKRFPQFIFPSKPPRESFESDEEHIKGATVDEPVAGIYPVLNVVDQTSLYPTVVISAHMSPENVDPNGDIKLGNGVCFNSKNKGIIADAVEYLLEIRLKYKKLAKNEPDAYKAQMYGLLSDGYKTLLVSFYGALLYKGFRLYDYKVAESIPYMGRVIKEHVRKLVEANGYRVIAGDSVTRESIIPVQNELGEISFQTIESLYITTISINGEKEYYIPYNLKTLSVDKDGKVSWNKIKSVMRHTTTKKIYNVSISNKWSVNVTEDHSLMGYANVVQMKKLKLPSNFIETKPTEIGKPIKSIASLKYIPRTNISSKNYPKELYEFMGLFIGDGSFELNKSGTNCYCVALSAGKDSIEISNKILTPLQTMGYISRFYIRENGYDIRIYGNNITAIMDEFRIERNKIIPKWIEYESLENISSFLRGLFESDGSISKRNRTYIITFTNIRENFINKIQELLWYVGIPSGICVENNTNKYKGIDSNTYTLRLNIRNNMNYKNSIGFITERKQELINDIISGNRKGSIEDKDFDVVNHLKVSQIEYDNYVYDLEVENIHTFFANGILVHNTDSSFLLPLSDDSLPIDKLVELINKSFDEFSKSLGMPTHRFNIELDKVFSPIIMSDVKKRYVGYITKNGKKIYKSVGFESVRRDAAPITEMMQEDVFKLILNGANRKVIEKYIEQLYKDIESKKYPMEMLGLPKGFSKDFNKFKVKSQWITGVEYANKSLGMTYDHFTEIQLFHIKQVPEGKEYTDVISLDVDHIDLINDFIIDWKVQLDKLIGSKVQNIYDMLKWIPSQQRTLGDF